MRDTLSETIPRALADQGPATGPELAARLDAHPATVERYCRQLQAAGRIRQGTGGQYVVDGASEAGYRVASD
jgi:DNA-binding IclR family transcriptional regulator